MIRAAPHVQPTCPASISSWEMAKAVSSKNLEIIPASSENIKIFESAVAKVQETLEKKFKDLENKYYTVLRAVQGTGQRGELYVQTEWKKLKEFVKSHPEFSKRIPKYVGNVYYDGYGGFASGSAEFAQTYNK